MDKLNITFCSTPDFGGNAKAVYEYMQDKYDFNYTWIVYSEENRVLLQNKGIKAILIGTDEFKEYIPTTDIFFTTHGNLDGDKTDKSLYIELWHGIGPKPNGFLMDNPNDEYISWYDNIRKIVDYYTVPTDFWKIVFSSVFHVESARVKSLGMPILDYFKNSNGKENMSKVLGKDFSKYDKTIIYMPTFRKGCNREDVQSINLDNIFNFSSYDESKLNNYLKENNYLLCVKRHPAEMNKFKEFESDNIVNINDQKLIENDLSVNEIINAFDLMISDYSSIATEWLYFDRPILYALGDEEEYSKTRGIIFSNIDFWTAGPQVSSIDKLIVEMDKLLKDDNYYKEERKIKKNLWFPESNQNNCENLCNFLFDGNKISNEVKYYKDMETFYKRELNKTNEELQVIKNNLEEKEKEIYDVYNSKGWKFLESLRKVKKPFSKK